MTQNIVGDRYVVIVGIVKTLMILVQQVQVCRATMIHWTISQHSSATTFSQSNSVIDTGANAQFVNFLSECDQNKGI